MDFVVVLIEAIDGGKYKHEGKIDNWIGVMWKNHHSKVKEVHWIESNLTVGINLTDEVDEDGEITFAGTDRVNPTDVDHQAAVRDTPTLNDAPHRVSRMLRELSDPQTDFGKLDESTKAIIRALAGGNSKDVAATKNKTSVHTLNTWLREEVKPLRQATFVTSEDFRDNLKAVGA